MTKENSISLLLSEIVNEIKASKFSGELHLTLSCNEGGIRNIYKETKEKVL